MNGTAPIGQSPEVLDSPEVSQTLSGRSFAEQVQMLRQEREYLEFRLRLQADVNESTAELIQHNQAHVDRLREKLKGLEMILDVAPPELQRDPKRLARWIAEQRGILPASPVTTGTGAAVGADVPMEATAAPASIANNQDLLARTEGVCLCQCYPCAHGDHCHSLACGVEQGKKAILDAVFTPLDKAANPNAGAKKAYPHGRWP